MDTKAPNLIPSGIEPVDKLLGGLESGQMYLVHGEASGKSLFGIKFLIEGLKRGEHGALVIRYSPEDAVRRFARLGYDCLEDVYSGRLVILEYSDDIIQQVSRLRELTPVLRELEWLLGEAKAQRLIFDPVSSLVAGAGNLQSRVDEFTAWAHSFGATVVFIANGDEGVVDAIRPHTTEVFRFQVKDDDEKATRTITFEKSAIPEQSIEVDPSRGIFLLERARSPEHFFSVFQGAQPPIIDAQSPEEPQGSNAPLVSEISAQPAEPVEISDFDVDRMLEPFAEASRASEQALSTGIIEPPAPAAPAIIEDAPRTPAEPQPLIAPQTVEPQAASEPAVAQQSVTPDTSPLSPEAARQTAYVPPTQPAQAQDTAADTTNDAGTDFFAELIEELTQEPAPPVDQSPELLSATASFGEQIAPVSPTGREQTATGDVTGAQNALPVAAEPLAEPLNDTAATDSSSVAAEPLAESLSDTVSARQGTISADVSSAPAEPSRAPHRRAADERIDSAMTARAVEVLLRPPDSQTSSVDEEAVEPVSEPTGRAVLQPKDCNVLIIDDDPASCDLIAQTLEGYTIEVVHDGMSGLARLIAFKPDLVVLSLDLPIIDGFKVLEHIRQGLNMPVILITGTRMRASDRVLAAELGADYYLTKPYSPKELRHKARQLIARYRGINAWLTVPAGGPGSEFGAPPLNEPLVLTVPSPGEQFLSYPKFTEQVEECVRATLESNATFAIVGCRVPQMTARGGHIALRLYDLIRRLIRDTDLLSTNPRNDIVILLTEANANGARAFVSRLRERITNELRQEPGIWLRSFPDLEESTSSKDWTYRTSNGSSVSRRAADRQTVTAPEQSAADTTVSRDPRESYSDFLEQM